MRWKWGSSRPGHGPGHGPEFRSGARSRREPEGRDPAPEPVEPGGLPGSSNRSPHDDGWPMPAHFIPAASASGSVGRNIHPPEGKPKPERKIALSKKSPLLNASIPKFPPRWCRSATPPWHLNGHPETRRLQQRERISKGVCRSRVRTPREQSVLRFGLRRKLFAVNGLRGSGRASLCHRAPPPCRDDSAPERTADERLCMPRGRRMSGAARNAPGGERPCDGATTGVDCCYEGIPDGSLR